MNTTSLKRTISLPALVFYGPGTMVGGGFHALPGKVAKKQARPSRSRWLRA